MVFDPADRVSVVSFIRRHARGVVATVSPAYVPEAALVGLVALDDGRLLLNTFASSRKLANLRANPAIAVVVGTEGEVSLQLEGTAAIASTEQHATLADEFLRHAPGSRVHDEGFTLVVVSPDWVRFYDATGKRSIVSEARWTSDGR